MRLCARPAWALHWQGTRRGRCTCGVDIHDKNAMLHHANTFLKHDGYLQVGR